jgi:mono/diheme cytochrome c family protein
MVIMKTTTMMLVLLFCSVPAIAIADGRTDYNARCAGCHGANANVQTEKAKALKMVVRKLSLRASPMDKAGMIATVEKGRGMMPAFENDLTKEQAAAIVDYVRALSKKK